MHELPNLGRLTRSMLACGIERQRFEYVHGRGIFDVFYCLGSPDAELLLGARGADPPLAISIAVVGGKYVHTYLGTQYGALCEYLGLRYNPDNPFSTRDFFMQLDEHVPRAAIPTRSPRYQDLVEYRGRERDRDGRWFLSWKQNAPPETNVTEENLRKTKELLGCRAFEICKRHNISSCWTHDRSRAREPGRPAPGDRHGAHAHRRG